MGHKKHPTKEFIKDLEAVFAKHNWSGNMIGFASKSAAAAAVNQCPPGKTPTVVHYKLPNGKEGTKVVCK